MTPSKFCFLDRDGTINVERSGSCHRVEDFAFTDHAIEGMKLLQDAGYRLVCVTNQGGIGRGIYTLHEMEAVNRWLLNHCNEQGVRLETIAYCPHHPDEKCSCRKPQTAMAHTIEKQLDVVIDYSNSWMIGDKLSDVDFGKNLGMQAALITSPYWTNAGRATISGASLYSLAQAIPGLSFVRNI